VFTGFMGLVQVFFIASPEDILYFANPGSADRFRLSYLFHWADMDNHAIYNWKELINGKNHILSIPEAHKMIGYYTVPDRDADVLKVCRSYQCVAIKAIVRRTMTQKWGNHDQKGGFVWCTTGGGKTLTSFKAGQLIIDLNLADKVVFVVDRKALDDQSAKEYNSFERDGEFVVTTTSSWNLFQRLKAYDHEMILTSIQKLSHINADAQHIDKATLDVISEKRIVFIIDEAHRSQFGEMHRSVEDTFYNALFFGFTGTPIMAKNMKQGEQTTESVFGNCLAVYSLASGIRDGNVLGFWPEYIKTFRDEDVREAIALHEAKVRDISQLVPGTENYKTYKYYKDIAPMVSTYDKDGKLLEKGIEDFLSSADYNSDAHREAVVGNILDNIYTVSHGTKGTLFHGILATSSIPEAYEYWKLFQKKAQKLHVTALFDPNVNSNEKSTSSKEQHLIEIIIRYNKDFGTQYNRKTDPGYAAFKEDIMSRLSHKQAYKYIGNDPSKCLDLVIVVDQLLTGFDSAYINVIYMDKVMESEALIQAISRTNRIYDKEEKPNGLVKFYRKPESMKKKLENALELYCQGDSDGVQEKELKDNIIFMNRLFNDISDIFSHDKIENFSRLPSADEDKQAFRKNFLLMKAAMRSSILQGFKWSNEWGKKTDFDETTYKTLTMRFSEIPGSGGHRPPVFKPGFGLDTDVSSARGAQIDAEYLEARFRILTTSEVINSEIVQDIKSHLGTLPEILQQYALKVLADVENKKLSVEPGKRFMEYIHEYQEKHIFSAIKEEAEKFGLNEQLFLEIYKNTGSNGIDQIKLKKLENSADINLVMEYFKTSKLMAKIKLHAELSNFILDHKAEK
ncbi:MAG: DEAD/DEAH box helicase family protein, partial [Oribacterium sp.]|nr:DEAD/DEAH box helicase family protein [Oribacterium sp.]